MARSFACWCVRETPLASGRKVWDLLVDERSRNAVVVAELFANGDATREELQAANSAACSACAPCASSAYCAASAAACAAANSADNSAACASSAASADA
jgi:hypothetical protein